MANEQNLKPFKPGQSGNPKGAKKGSIHLSTHIQNLMADDAFEANILDAKTGIKEYKGMPVIAIIQVAITKAVNGDEKAREWLAKYGWKTQLDITTNDESLRGEVDPTVAGAFAEFLRNKN